MLRAEADQRPTTISSPAPAGHAAEAASSRTARDTSRAHLAGAQAFSIQALTRPAPAGTGQGGEHA